MKAPQLVIDDDDDDEAEVIDQDLAEVMERGEIIESMEEALIKSNSKSSDKITGKSTIKSTIKSMGKSNSMNSNMSGLKGTSMNPSISGQDTDRGSNTDRGSYSSSADEAGEEMYIVETEDGDDQSNVLKYGLNMA